MSKPMTNLAQTLANPASQAQLRLAMQHSRSFQIEYDLPNSILAKLAELDRVTAADDEDTRR